VQRILEPELMGDPQQARAYAEADFESPNSQFLSLFETHFPAFSGDGYILDLGCGPADIDLRFAERYPEAIVHGVDGAEAMLNEARHTLARRADLAGRIELILARLPDLDLPQARYAAVISNSLLHHLHRPEGLWKSVRDYARPGAPVLVMDLMRPNTPEEARAIVDTYAADEPEVLRRDFFNSLLAAFEPREVSEQLENAGLSQLRAEPCSDRHLLVHGHA